MRAIASVVLVLVLAGCAFGLLGTREPGTSRVWVIAYACAGFVCLAGLGVLAFSRRSP